MAQADGHSAGSSLVSEDDVVDVQHSSMPMNTGEANPNGPRVNAPLSAAQIMAMGRPRGTLSLGVDGKPIGAASYVLPPHSLGQDPKQPQEEEPSLRTANALQLGTNSPGQASGRTEASPAMPGRVMSATLSHEFAPRPFGTEFLNSVAGSLDPPGADDFANLFATDATLRNESLLNFERDFAEWFSPTTGEA